MSLKFSNFKWLITVFAVSVQSMAADLPGFKVAGRYLYDRCGEKVILRGINKMIVWTDLNGTSFPEIAKTGANCVRIVWVKTGALDKFDAAITKCRENKMIPIVELHDGTGVWDSLPGLVNWWVKPEVISIIQKHEEYLLVNIGNEVGNQVSVDDFKKGYSDAVKKMREAGIHVPLVIDAAKWGQDIDILQAAGPDIITADPDHNILLSVHMWWPDIYGWNDKKISDEIAQSVQMNLPLIVGEFGNTAANCQGVINYKLIIEECQKNEIGWLAWSWGPGNSDCATMDMTTDSKFETLRGWGLEVAVTDPNSIKNTSVISKFMQSGLCDGNQAKRFAVSVISSGRGNVTMSPNKVMVDSGTTISFTAKADANNEFKNWSGSVTGTENPLTLTIDKDINLIAVFSDNGPAVGAELIKNSDFSDGKTGWTFSAWGGAEGTGTVTDGQMVVAVTTKGEFGYNAQLFTTGIDLSAGKSYVVSFKAMADKAYELSMNVGLKQDPWTTYSGYQKFNITTEMKSFSFDFTMPDTSDPDSRIVFDVGTVDGKIYFDDISVKPVGGSAVLMHTQGRAVYSIPYLVKYRENNSFVMTTQENIQGSFELIDITGKRLGRTSNALYGKGTHLINFGSKKISSGAYFIRLV
ncbi:MAG: cellulase family glycosylhydrolase, partial [Fibrobacter sp.]|nr:cellulase family glycosylhydrolase [Fibrobacter sp.]